MFAFGVALISGGGGCGAFGRGRRGLGGVVGGGCRGLKTRGLYRTNKFISILIVT